MVGHHARRKSCALGEAVDDKSKVYNEEHLQEEGREEGGRGGEEREKK
jgi:hypothetical protein